MNIVLENHEIIKFVANNPWPKEIASVQLDFIPSDLDSLVDEFLLLLLKEIKTISELVYTVTREYTGNGKIALDTNTIHSVGTCIALRYITGTIVWADKGLIKHSNIIGLLDALEHKYSKIIELWLESNGDPITDASRLHPVSIKFYEPSSLYSRNAKESTMYVGKYGQKRKELLNFAINYLSGLQTL
ncbi:hypothetical protein TH1_153 [Shewanella phage Thanatos-1]|nr:hypothetical protein TH1_153 [Shewanella phage Thanatos-1]